MMWNVHHQILTQDIFVQTLVIIVATLFILTIKSNVSEPGVRTRGQDTRVIIPLRSTQLIVLMLWSVDSMFEWTRLHDICVDICMDRWSIGAVISIQYCILAISGQLRVQNHSVAQGNTIIISSSYAIMQPSAPWSVVVTTRKNIYLRST